MIQTGGRSTGRQLQALRNRSRELITKISTAIDWELATSFLDRDAEPRKNTVDRESRAGDWLPEVANTVDLPPELASQCEI